MGGIARNQDRAQFDAKFGERERDSTLSSSPTASFSTETINYAGNDAGAFSSGTAFSLVQLDAGFPMSRNVHVGNMISAVTNMFDDQDERGLWANLTHGSLAQLNGLSNNRSSRVSDWQGVNSRNPLAFFWLHDTPLFGGVTAYERSASTYGTYMYKFLEQNDRQTHIYHLDHRNWQQEINGNDTPSSGFNQSSVTPNINTAAVRNYMADLASDLLMGTSYSSGPALGSAGEGGNLSSFCGYFRDRTVFNEAASNAKFERSQQNGVIDAVNIVTNSHVKQLTIDSDPGSGVIGERIYFFPANSPGFIGYRISGYVSFGGTAVLTLEDLPGAASTSQDYVPVAGHRYSIMNSNSQTNSFDVDSDGSAEGQVEAATGATNWIDAFMLMFDRIDSNVLSTSGHLSGRGWNGISKSFDSKESSGYPVPHPMTGLADMPTFENATEKWGFDPAVSGDPSYDVSSWDPLKMARAMGFAETFVKDTPNAFMADKPRGAVIECMTSGNYTNFQNNNKNAHMQRFHWAVIACNQKLAFGAQREDISSGGPSMIDENFIDLNSNYITPAPLWTYNEDDGGPEGSAGPLHEAIFAAADWGERGYARRIGDWLILVNLADKPNSSYDDYDPDSYTVRTNDDQVLPADFTSFYSAGYLSAGETLEFFDPSTYRNDVYSQALQEAAPSVWGASAPGGPYYYGCREATVWDGTYAYTTSTLPLLCRDDTWNPGGSVNQGVALDVPVMTARVLKVIPAP